MRGVGPVFVGGAVGSLARHLLGLALPGLWPVLVVNVLGSFALGLLLGSRPEPGRRLLLGTGFLGGFTTYSAFAVDVVGAGAAGGPVLGLVMGAGQAALGVVAALLGFAVADAADARRRRVGAGA